MKYSSQTTRDTSNIKIASKCISRIGQTYAKISNEVRKELIHLVANQGMKLKRAATVCKLKPSTAKAIIAVYQTEGRIGKKPTRNKFPKKCQYKSEKTFQEDSKKEDKLHANQKNNSFGFNLFKLSPEINPNPIQSNNLPYTFNTLQNFLNQNSFIQFDWNTPTNQLITINNNYQYSEFRDKLEKKLSNTELLPPTTLLKLFPF